jgi:NAD(P)H dehydrogenase (quinone)
MDQINLAIIYYSSTGTNHQLASWAKEAAQKMDVKNIKLLKIPETAPKEALEKNEKWKKHHLETSGIPHVKLEDLEWANAIVFCIPTRYGNLPSQFTSFTDTTGELWSSGKLANKVVTGMCSASNSHGGQETTLFSLYKMLFHWGAIVVTPGYTSEVLFQAGGNPYGLSLTAGNEKTEIPKKAAYHQVERMLTLATKIHS